MFLITGTYFGISFFFLRTTHPLFPEIHLNNFPLPVTDFNNSHLQRCPGNFWASRMIQFQPWHSLLESHIPCMEWIVNIFYQREGPFIRLDSRLVVSYQDLTLDVGTNLRAIYRLAIHTSRQNRKKV